MKKVLCVIICLWCSGIVFDPPFLSVVPCASEKMIKTSYKNYKVVRLENETVICEPYRVKKDDWLYKIFRKKGMISEENFPHFLDIFSRINPEIRNIDLIEPGENIIIPLKKAEKDEYRETSPGIVKVPLLEYEKVPDAVKQYVSSHKVQAGESVSKLIDKKFLDEEGYLTEQGRKAFKIANPGIKNIDMIYKGSTIYLPDPEMQSEQWFEQLFKARAEKEEKPKEAQTKKDPAASDRKKFGELDPYQLSQLKRYASLIEGTLMARGEYRFPSGDDDSGRLDLSSTPLIRLKNGNRILLVPPDMKNQALVEQMQAHWNNLKVKKISEIIDNSGDSVIKSVPETNEAFVERLLSFTDYDVEMESEISFSYDSVKIDVKIARVSRKNSSDLLIDFGEIYGNAFDILKAEGYSVISIKPEEKKMEAALKLFSALDLPVTKNPAFEKKRRILRAKGVYISNIKPELFVTGSELQEDTRDYIESRKIQIINLTPSKGNKEAE